MNIEVNVSL